MSDESPCPDGWETVVETVPYLDVELRVYMQRPIGRPLMSGKFDGFVPDNPFPLEKAIMWLVSYCNISYRHARQLAEAHLDGEGSHEVG